MEGMSKGIPLITIPIIISLLSDENYAFLGLYQSLTMVFFYFISLGSNSAVSKAFATSSVEFDYACGNVIVSILITMSVFVFFSCIFSMSSVYVYSFFGSISILIISIHRDISYIGKNDDYIFVTNPFFIFISQIFLLLCLFYYPELSFQSKFFADLITAFFVIGLLSYFGFYKLIKFKKPRFSLEKLVYSLKYSLPLSIRQSYPWLKSVLEREIFINFYSVKVLSSYTLAFQIAMALILLVNVYISSKLPDIYRAINSRNFFDVKRYFYQLSCLFVFPPLLLIAFTNYIFSSYSFINITCFLNDVISIEFSYLLCAIYLIYSVVYVSQSLMIYFYQVNDVAFPLLIQTLMWVPIFLIFAFNVRIDLNNLLMISLASEVFCVIYSLIYFNKSIKRSMNENS